eukprot:2204372-Pyramimonas_sp.AAC.1
MAKRASALGTCCSGPTLSVPRVGNQEGAATLTCESRRQMLLNSLDQPALLVNGLPGAGETVALADVWFPRGPPGWAAG